jgi:hypothetical protein
MTFKTDNGTEYLGCFTKFLADHGIWHKTAMAYHKSSMAPVEGLNGVLGRILVNYLNNKSMELGKDYSEWTDILPEIRIEVNEYRKRDLNKLKQYQTEHYFDVDKAGEPEYHIGQFVYYRLDRPTDIHGDVQPDSTKWRKGDRLFSVDSRKIIEVLYMRDAPWFRYKLFELPFVSYSSYDLKLASKQDENYLLVKKIIGKKIENKVKYYLVWWKRQLKGKATWEPETQLLEDGLEDYIKEFEKDARVKAQKRR